MRVSRTERLAGEIRDFFVSAIGEECDRWNTEDTSLDLPVMPADHTFTGYRDILDGSYPRPCMAVVVPSRSNPDSYTTRCHVVVGIALENADQETVEKWGYAYMDMLEDVVMRDTHLGGACLETLGLGLKSDELTGKFVIEAQFDVDVDRGGFYA